MWLIYFYNRGTFVRDYYSFGIGTTSFVVKSAASMHFVGKSKVFSLIKSNCLIMHPKFSLSELSDSFSFLFFYCNGHASILIDQEEVVMISRPVGQEGHCFFSY